MIRVLVVDDSALVQRILSKELANTSDIQVVGTAVDPYVAREKIAELRPDVITLDIEMPRMDGLTFLEKLMQHLPMPVVVVSSLTPANSPMALRALQLGAVEVVPKPGGSMSTPDVQGILARAIRAAAMSKPGARRAPSTVVKTVESSLITTDKVVMVGASTGGTRAVEVLLKGLPRASPGMVICQHMPANFISTFARRLGEVAQMEVREAQDGDAVVLGRVLVAPGGSHTMLVRSGAKYIVRLKEGPPVHFQRPAVDVLFHSAARAAGANAVGILLTGMGSDGAAGLKAMRDAGAHTIVESEETCVVFGMPRAAIELGAATKVLPLHQVGPSFMEWIHANAV